MRHPLPLAVPPRPTRRAGSTTPLTRARPRHAHRAPSPRAQCHRRQQRRLDARRVDWSPHHTPHSPTQGRDMAPHTGAAAGRVLKGTAARRVAGMGRAAHRAAGTRTARTVQCACCRWYARAASLRLYLQARRGSHVYATHAVSAGSTGQNGLRVGPARRFAADVQLQLAEGRG